MTITVNLVLSGAAALTVTLSAPRLEAIMATFAESFAAVAADFAALKDALTADEAVDHAKIADLQAQVDALKALETVTPEQTAQLVALDAEIKALKDQIAPPAPPAP